MHWNCVRRIFDSKLLLRVSQIFASLLQTKSTLIQPPAHTHTLTHSLSCSHSFSRTHSHARTPTITKTTTSIHLLFAKIPIFAYLPFTHTLSHPHTRTPTRTSTHSPLSLSPSSLFPLQPNLDDFIRFTFACTFETEKN